MGSCGQHRPSCDILAREKGNGKAFDSAIQSRVCSRLWSLQAAQAPRSATVCAAPVAASSKAGMLPTDPSGLDRAKRCGWGVAHSRAPLAAAPPSRDERATEPAPIPGPFGGTPNGATGTVALPESEGVLLTQKSAPVLVVHRRTKRDGQIN